MIRIVHSWIGRVVALALGITICARFASSVFAGDIDFETVKKAADNGDAKAQFETALCYERGTSLKQDYGTAVQYLMKSADQGYALAELRLGYFYSKGMGLHRNMVEAVKWYRKAADQGNAFAQYAMGKVHAEGSAGVQKDIEEALRWWEKSAAQNQPEAQNALGQFYLRPADTNHPPDYVKAVTWLRKAADQGFVASMNNLGTCFEEGTGVEKDFTEAAKWYRIAAEKGNRKSQANLGLMYLDGRGVPEDPVQAYKWLKLSALRGDPVGQHYLPDLSRKTLTPEQLAEAEKQVAEFSNTNSPPSLLQR
jgi:TPR repeat protein